jgi:hypothetical protein
MWLNLIGMAVKTGADVYKRKQETKSLQALAERNHAEKNGKGRKLNIKVELLIIKIKALKTKIVFGYCYLAYYCYCLLCFSLVLQMLNKN